MTGKVTVLCGDDQRLREAFSDLANFEVAFAEKSSDITISTDCVVVSQSFVEPDLRSNVMELKMLRLPVAIASFADSAEEQNALAESGADDVIILPLCSKLLQNRLQQLVKSAVKGVKALPNFEAFERIREANQGRGSFLVEEHDFTTVYCFVSRILERLEQKAQLVILDFSNPMGSVELAEDIRNFTKIVRACLRRGDIFAVCDTRIMLILVGTNLDDGLRVLKRLTDTFEAYYYNSYSKIRYEMREINK